MFKPQDSLLKVKHGKKCSQIDKIGGSTMYNKLDTVDRMHANTYNSYLYTTVSFIYGVRQQKCSQVCQRKAVQIFISNVFLNIDR